MIEKIIRVYCDECRKQIGSDFRFMPNDRQLRLMCKVRRYNGFRHLICEQCWDKKQWQDENTKKIDM